MGGAMGTQKWKINLFFELHISKSNDQIFKNLTFLKTRDKTTSNKKKPTPPYGGPWGGGSKTSRKIEQF